MEFVRCLAARKNAEPGGNPFRHGTGKRRNVDSVTSNFPSGVSLKVMRIGVPWAQRALEHYEPKDVPESEKQQWLEEVDVRCPICRSKDIVFERMVEMTNSTPKYKWTC